MNQIKLKKLNEFSDQFGDWVVCQSQGLKWTLKKEIFTQFKCIGLPPMESKTYKKLATLLGNQHYPALSKEKRYTLIKQLLETTTKSPISSLFTNL